MRLLLLTVSAVAVIGLAYWAYSENYQTQLALREAETLNTEIAELRERLGVLRAEWAYLNRPDRLRDLAAINYDRLGLLPLNPAQFERIDQLPFPADLGFPTVDAIDLASILGESE